MEVIDGGYTAQFYNGKGGEPLEPLERVTELPLLTAEMVADDNWFIFHHFYLHEGEEHLMEVVRKYNQSYFYLKWQNSHGTMVEKLVPLLGLHQDLVKAGYNVGKARILIWPPPSHTKLENNYFTGEELFELEQLPRRDNQKRVNESKAVHVEADWMDFAVDGFTPIAMARQVVENAQYTEWTTFAFVRLKHRIPTELLLRAFAASYYKPDFLNEGRKQELAKCLEGLLDGFSFQNAPMTKTAITYTK